MPKNPLFNILNGQPVNMGNDFLVRFNQFKQAFSGDPQQQIQQLLNSGKITQGQYNQAVKKANELINMLK